MPFIWIYLTEKKQQGVFHINKKELHRHSHKAFRKDKLVDLLEQMEIDRHIYQYKHHNTQWINLSPYDHNYNPLINDRNFLEQFPPDNRVTGFGRFAVNGENVTRHLNSTYY